MIVYRITKKEHSALDGVGGLYGPGRWHKKGNLVIYTSEHASLAAWEKIVHVTSFENLPENLLLVKIELPDGIEIQSVPRRYWSRDGTIFLLHGKRLISVLLFCKKKNTWHLKYLLSLFRMNLISY